MNPVRDAMHRSQLPGRLPAGTHGALAICKRKPDEAHINNASLLFSSTLQRGGCFKSRPTATKRSRSRLSNSLRGKGRLQELPRHTGHTKMSQPPR